MKMDLLTALLENAGEGSFVWLHGEHTGSMLVAGGSMAHQLRSVESKAKSGLTAMSELFS